ncbi:MAG TPA: acylneuraminate cytidylyltransferase family protein [Flavobacteriaceae bacterium]|nr:acylneuraminate cytidylyltransferase family protein [Flavobacteriaceae bacterium]
MSNFVFFLPTRKGSERIKHKNTRQFAGYDGGLVALKLKQLLQIPDIPILISTNDPKTISVAESYANPRIEIIKRPEKLSQSNTDLQNLINYIPTITNAEHIVWTHVTSPFITAKVYQKAVEQYKKHLGKGYDSLMSVTKIQEFLWDKKQNTTINFDRSQLKWPRTQDLNPLYAVNSGIFINSRQNYLDQEDRIGQKPYLLEINALESMDIDWIEDFITTEKIYEALQ